MQRELLQALRATGKPLVIVLTSGSALAVPEEHQYASAILEAWYPGEEGGTAIAETLAGDNNPAGRLPLTFYASTDQLPPFEDYSMANRTYRYFTGKPLYGFGYGLSYSQFQYRNPKLSSPSVEGRRTGHGRGRREEHAAAAPATRWSRSTSRSRRPPSPRCARSPVSRVSTSRPGETVHVAIPIDPRTLGQVDEKGERVIVPGTYSVAIGGAQPAEFPGAVTATFDVTGSQTLPR